MRDNCADFADLFLNDRPMMDARAPVEFAKGAFPGVINLPLMNDIERQKVGTCYKQKGQQAAIELGHQLVSGAIKAQRIEAWATFARQHPDGYLYCFRGGLRSQIVQQWLHSEAGITYPRVVGGYKAMRTYLIETTEQALAECQFVLVGGMTGTGKTEVIAQLDNAIDLEGHANHRGSSFGKQLSAQPSQIDFENVLAIDVLKKRARGLRQFVLEDEARLIGRCSLPYELHVAMQHYPLVWLEDSLHNRVQRILATYVVELAAQFTTQLGACQGLPAFAERLRESLANIQRRLGGERYKRLATIMDQALREQLENGRVDTHVGWIEALLVEYYDPMYVFQRQEKAGRIEFSGEQAAVVEYLRQRQA